MSDAPNNDDDEDVVDRVFGAHGLLAKRAASYEHREGQVRLARAVDAAIKTDTALLAEAGTGTGKTISYLVPAIYRATHAESEEDGRVVVVTSSIPLQEQLVSKDLPLLAEVLPWSFSYALIKGKSNYLCLDRLKEVQFDMAGGSHQDDDQLLQIEKWARTTQTGDKSELPFEPKDKLWSKFSVGSDDCTGDKCEFYGDCHSRKAKAAMMKATVIVTNYHYLFTAFKVKQVTGMDMLLPPHGTTILDEGHAALKVARDIFGWTITEGVIKWAGKMLDDRRIADKLAAASDVFFKDLETLRRSDQYRVRIKSHNVQALSWEPLVEALIAARKEYSLRADLIAPPLEESVSKCSEGAIFGELDVFVPRHTKGLSKNAEKMLVRLEKKIRRISELIAQIVEMSKVLPDDVYYVSNENKREKDELCSQPLRVDERLHEHLFKPGQTTVVSSATLLANNSFSYIAGELGAGSPGLSPATLVEVSPFDYRFRVLLVLPEDMPVYPQSSNKEVRKREGQEYNEAAANMLVRTIKQARGRTLALFTNKDNRDFAYEKVRAAGLGYRLLLQGEMPRTKLIEAFREDIHSILFGVSSFWEGVDVQGEALSCVFMDKLPFPRFDDPVIDVFKDLDSKWFMKYYLPPAVISFKQAFGRLMRHSMDYGAVVCCDSKRIAEKNYGPIFKSAVPRTMMGRRVEEIGPFLDKFEFPPVGWFKHPEAPGCYHNGVESLWEADLRARMAKK